MANLGCIELNPWNSRISHLDNPDFLLIDLDPLEVDFPNVIETAIAVKEILDEIEVGGHCKTSGATGLHIYIPLGAKYSYDQTRQFAEIIANLVNKRMPKITSVERSPEKRKGKVYLDFLQNRRGQTLAAPYSVRPKTGAPVSTPLKWDEVKIGLDPRQFTMRNIFNRLGRIGDIWKPVLGEGIEMGKIIQKIEKIPH
jgi:bifunctional non-homologous end joining protein LigD